MKKKDLEIFIDELIKKFHPSPKDEIKYRKTTSIEDKVIYLETCISYILFDNESLKREIKAKVDD